MSNKYEFTSETTKVYGHTLHRIRAVRCFSDVKAGDLGGQIEKEYNLSHEDHAWVCDEGKVYGDARVIDDARVLGCAKVYDNALIEGRARVCNHAQVYNKASVSHNVEVGGNAMVYNHAMVYDNALVLGNAKVYDFCCISGKAQVSDEAAVYDHARVLYFSSSLKMICWRNPINRKRRQMNNQRKTIKKTD